MGEHDIINDNLMQIMEAVGELSELLGHLDIQDRRFIAIRIIEDAAVGAAEANARRRAIEAQRDGVYLAKSGKDAIEGMNEE